MNKIIFSNSSQIQIQGDAVLKIKENGPKKAIYELIGFECYPVLIEDERQAGLSALQDFLMDNCDKEFAPRFNQPAQVTITQESAGCTIIHLSETENRNPDFMLWIAIGIKEPLPEYSFLIYENIPYLQNKRALLSLYERPKVSNQPQAVSNLRIDIPNPRSSNFGLQG